MKIGILGAQGTGKTTLIKWCANKNVVVCVAAGWRCSTCGGHNQVPEVW